MLVQELTGVCDDAEEIPRHPDVARPVHLRLQQVVALSQAEDGPTVSATEEEVAEVLQEGEVVDTRPSRSSHLPTDGRVGRKGG